MRRNPQERATRRKKCMPPLDVLMLSFILAERQINLRVQQASRRPFVCQHPHSSLLQHKRATIPAVVSDLSLSLGFVGCMVHGDSHCLRPNRRLGATEWALENKQRAGLAGRCGMTHAGRRIM